MLWKAEETGTRVALGISVRVSPTLPSWAFAGDTLRELGAGVVHVGRLGIGAYTAQLLS